MWQNPAGSTFFFPGINLPEKFIVDGNRLSGTFPSEISEITSLETVFLQDNSFVGEFDKIFSNMSSLGERVPANMLHMAFFKCTSRAFIVHWQPFNSHFKSSSSSSICCEVQLNIESNEFGGVLGTNIQSLFSLGAWNDVASIRLRGTYSNTNFFTVLQNIWMPRETMLQTLSRVR